MNTSTNEPTRTDIAGLIAALDDFAVPAASPSGPTTGSDSVRNAVLHSSAPAQAAWDAHAVSGSCGCPHGTLLADCDLWNDALVAEDERQ